jgi:sigma-E factor negative regulatory protein RseC
MIEESATVVDIDSHGVWVETIKRSACESCSASNGCGQKLLVSRSSNKRFLVNVSNPKNITVEKKDTVLIGIEEGAFLKATLLVYLLPLVFLITGAVISQLAGFSEQEKTRGI